jgi:transposase
MQAIKIHGTIKQIKQLVQHSKQAFRDGFYRVGIRFNAIALNMEGKPAPEIASALKVHRSKVSIWLQNYQQEGIDGLLEGYRPGRPQELSEKQYQVLSDILDSGPIAYGFNSGVWTCPMVARVIEEEFSVSYHPAHVSRILHKLKFSVQRPQRLLAKADATLQSRWVRYKYPNLKKKPISREQ